MSLHRTLVSVILLAAIPLGSSVLAQNVGFLGKGDDNSDFTSLYDPFCDLDTHWFEPIYCDCPEGPLNSGWFFGYSRMHLNVSRPRSNDQVFYDPDPDPNFPTPLADQIPSIYQGMAAGDHEGDWAWGNRFDFGWISEEGNGFWFVARKLDSPDERVTFDNIDLNDDAAVRPDDEPWGPTFATVNGLRMWGFEGNKIWRLAPTPKGTVLEPFVGLRYVRLRDHADRNDIFTNAFEQLQFPEIGPANGTVLRTVDFNYRDAQITTDNDLFGGQLGVRSRWRRGRWEVTSDLRALLFWNHQSREIIGDNELQAQNFAGTYDANGQLAGVAESGLELQSFGQDQSYDTANTFVYGGELDLQLSFDVTKGFALTLGGQVIAFGDGVGRGMSSTDDSLVMTGVTAGFAINR